MEKAEDGELRNASCVSSQGGARSYYDTTTMSHALRPFSHNIKRQLEREREKRERVLYDSGINNRPKAKSGYLYDKSDQLLEDNKHSKMRRLQASKPPASFPFRCLTKSTRVMIAFCCGLVLGCSFMSIRNSLLLTTILQMDDKYHFEETHAILPPPQEQQPEQELTTVVSSPSSTTATTTTIPNLSIGQQIVETTYNEVYKDLATKYCPDRGRDYFFDTSKRPYDKMKEFRECLLHMYHELYKNTTLIDDYPWWFMTLLRDVSNKFSGLHNGFHQMILSPNEVEMCTYEKGGSSSWKKVQQILFNQTDQPRAQVAESYDHLIEEDKKMNRQRDRFVFLRDPLDRFLSAFLDKCVSRRFVGEGHCEPSSVFQPEYLELQEKQKIIGYGEERKKYRNYLESPNATNIVSDLRKRIPGSKLLFDAYVDAFPLKWNLHFMPLSFHCGGLYNTLKYYKFLGNMGVNFYDDLNKLTKQYPSIKESVDQIFKPGDHQQKQHKVDTTNAATANSHKNVGVETQAASKVMEYYTPKTIRKVLEYTSIDYMLLQMPIPQWAEDMLLIDEENQKKANYHQKEQIVD